MASLSYLTGRQRRIVLSGTVTGKCAYHYQPEIIEDFVVIEQNVYDYDFYWSAQLYWRDPFNIASIRITPGIGKQVGYLLEVANGFGGSASQDTRANPGGPIYGYYDDTLTGTWSIELDVEEVLELTPMIEADSEMTDDIGWPAEPLVDEDAGFILAYTTARKDGLPATVARYYERARVGGTCTAAFSGTTARGTTVAASCSTTISSAIEIDYTAVVTGEQVGRSAPAGTALCRTEVEYHGLTIPSAYTRSGAYASVSISTPAATVKARCDSALDLPGDPPDNAGVYKRATHTLACQPPRKIRWKHLARCFVDDHPDGQTLRYQYGTDYNSETNAYDAHTRQVAANPDVAAEDQTQLFVTCGSSINDVVQSGQTWYSVGPVRAWLDSSWLSSSGEDARDWRVRFQLYPYSAMRIALAGTTNIVSGTGIVAAAAPNLPLSTPILEGYRYIRYDLTGDWNWAAPITFTIGGKTWSISGTAGTAVDKDGLIDLCNPDSGVPAALTTDERDGRYPLINQTSYWSPKDGDPDIAGQSDANKGWLFGVLDRPTQVAIGGIPTGKTLTFAAFELYATAKERYASVLESFMNDRLGWESETDHTYLQPILWLETERKHAACWPHRARIEPKTGASHSYVYWDLTTLKSFVDYQPGWTCTLRSVPAATPYLTTDASAKLLGGGLLAGNLDGYVYDPVGDDWWRNVDVPAGNDFGTEEPRDVWASYLVDQVSIYPGCTPCWIDYDATHNTPFILSSCKLLRAQAEGHRFPKEAVDRYVRLERDSDGADRGSVDLNDVDRYRTGTPWGFGNVNHKTRIVEAAGPFEGPYKAANRYRHHTSFRPATPATGTTPSYDVGWDQRHHRAFIKSGKVWYGYAKNSLSGGFTDADTGISGTACCIRVDRRSVQNRIWLEVETSGTVYLYKSDNGGGSFALAYTLGTGTAPAMCIVGGAIYSYRVDGTAVKGEIRDAAGTQLTTFTVSGVTVDAASGIAVAASQRQGGKVVIVLQCIVSGSITYYTSTDGVAFA